MIKTLHNQVIALAGLNQATYLVQQLARRGVAEAAAMETSIASIFKTDATDVEDVYGGLAGLATGLKKLIAHLEGRERVDPEQARYAAALILLESRFIGNRNLVTRVREGVLRLQPLAFERSMLDLGVLSELGDLYHHTISTLEPRVMIHGDQLHLTNPHNINKIRALLLAGLRSAVLWRQCGGTRWKLVLYRSNLLDAARTLYAQSNRTP